MNRGYFQVSKELMESDEWDQIHREITQHFKEVHRKEHENGIIEFHGYSDLFSIKPMEGLSQCYELWFENKDGIPRITHANPI